MHSPPGDVWNSWQLTLAAKLMVADWLWPFKVAVRVTFWLLLTDPELAENVALLWPVWTVTFAGTDSNPLLLLSSDTTAALVAAAFSFTVQVADRLLVNAAGVQDSDVSCADAAAAAVTAKVFEMPLRVAVSMATWLEVTAATLALNAALLCPAPTLTLAGTVTLVLLLDSVTLTALAGTALMVMVQAEVPGPVTLAVEQFRLLS